MKRLIGVILCLSLLMIACKKKQTEYISYTDDKFMYVNAPDGLRVRDAPSADGEKIGLLKDFEMVRISKEEDKTVNIGGVDGKWVYIINPIEGWIFDGFLEDYEPHIKRTSAIGEQEYIIEEKLIGEWKIIDVSPHNEKTEWLVKYTPIRMNFNIGSNFEYGIFSGSFNYELYKNVIELIGGWSYESEMQGQKDYGTYYLTDIKFIDNDHITLYSEIQPYDDVDYDLGGEKVSLKLERVK